MKVEIVVANLLRAGVLLAAAAVIAGLLLANPTVVRWGVYILVATPIARVAFTLIAFALEKDWIYVTITSIVLAVLAYGVWP